MQMVLYNRCLEICTFLIDTSKLLLYTPTSIVSISLFLSVGQYLILSNFWFLDNQMDVKNCFIPFQYKCFDRVKHLLLFIGRSDFFFYKLPVHILCPFFSGIVLPYSYVCSWYLTFFCLILFSGYRILQLMEVYYAGLLELRNVQDSRQQTCSE